MPNPARLVGGAGIGAHISGLQEDDYREIGEIANWNSVIVCTGSNACGKVGLYIILLTQVPTPRFAERIYETGTVTVTSGPSLGNIKNERTDCPYPIHEPNRMVCIFLGRRACLMSTIASSLPNSLPSVLSTRYSLAFKLRNRSPKYPIFLAHFHRSRQSFF